MSTPFASSAFSTVPSTRLIAFARLTAETVIVVPSGNAPSGAETLTFMPFPAVSLNDCAGILTASSSFTEALLSSTASSCLSVTGSAGSGSVPGSAFCSVTGGAAAAGSSPSAFRVFPAVKMMVVTTSITVITSARILLNLIFIVFSPFQNHSFHFLLFM